MSATPPQPAANPNPSINIASDRVAAIAGSFRVDEQGQSHYSVPLSIPAGTAGVAPSIALTYNSGGGNGVMGQGGSIDGLSGITRCRQTLYQDGKAAPITWTAQDRFCLDSARLIVVSGQYGHPNSIYRTEVDSFSVIKAIGGTAGHPDYFTVQAKDGSVTTYGAAGSHTTSEQEARDASGAETGKVYQWAISRFTDSVGNAIDYIYHNDTSGLRIQKIDYAKGSGSTPHARVAFQYIARSVPADVTAVYIGGYKFNYTQLLSKVVVYNDEALYSGNLLPVREYRLTYKTGVTGPFKQLARIDECLYGSSVCKKPTTLSWSQSQASGFSNTQHETTLSSLSNKWVEHKPVDINGDGLIDLVWRVRNKSGSPHSAHWYYALRQHNSNAFGPQRSIYYYVTADSRFKFPWEVMDYNGDGYQDVLLTVGATGNAEWHVFYGSATGISTNHTSLGIAAATHSERTQVADINSDGLPDFFYHDAHWFRRGQQVVDGALIKRRFSNVAEFTSSLLPGVQIEYQPNSDSWKFTRYHLPDVLQSGDFNGDGMMDLVGERTIKICYQDPDCIGEVQFLSQKTVVFIGKSTGSFEPWVSDADGSSERRVGDINGDGLADLLVKYGSGWKAYLSTGARLKAISSAINIANDERMILADHNRDGAQDIMYPDGGSLRVRLFNKSTETFSNPQIVPGVLISNHPEDQFYVMDVNGDGINDYVNMHNTKLTVQYGLGLAERVVQIDNGLGLRTNITYDSLTDPAVYQRDNDANAVNWNLPAYTQTLGKPLDEGAIYDITPNTQVVRSVRSTAPRAGGAPGSVNVNASSEVIYVYKGLKAQAGGRGLLGFNQIWSIDPESQIWTVTQYRQDFPFVGRPYVTEQFWFQTFTDAVLLSSGATYWSLQDWNNATAREAAPYPVYRFTTADRKGDLTHNIAAGQALTRVDQVMTVDEWGNVLTTQADHYDVNNNALQLVSELDTNNTYLSAGFSPVAAKRLGRLSQTVATHKRPGQPNVTRTARFTYRTSGAQKGLLHYEYQGVGTPDQLATEYQYGPRGNVIKKIQRGASGKQGGGGVQTRYERWVYDAFYRHRNASYTWTGNSALPSPAGGYAGELLGSRVTQRDKLGRPLTVADGYGITTTNKYGVFGRLQHSYQDIGTWTTTTYSQSRGFCPAGTQVRVTTSMSGEQLNEICLDALGREMRSKQLGFAGNQVIYRDTEYDYSSRPVHRSEPYFSTVSGGNIKWTRTAYDRTGRVTHVIAPNNSRSRITYNGRSTTTTNALSQSRTETRNVMGELTRVDDPLGAFVQYTYDATGNLIRTQVGNATQYVITTIAYDSLGRKTQMNDPDKGLWRYYYNAFGELVEQIDAKTQRSVIAYDPLGRMISRRDYSSGGTLAHYGNWQYDKVSGQATRPGRLITSHGRNYNSAGSAIASQVFKTFSYDQFSRSTGYGVNINNGEMQGVETLTYDEHSRIFQHFDITGEHWGVEYKYNNRGYLEEVRESRFLNANDPRTVYVKTQEMDARGNVTKELLGNGVTTTRQYDVSMGRLTHIGGSIGAYYNRQDLTMTYDVLGNLRSRWDKRESLSLRESYCYDQLNRLVKVHANTTTGSCGGYHQSNGDFRYDVLGNITYKTGVGHYQYHNVKKHAVRQAGSNHYSYDNNGSMIVAGSKTFTYATFDKPTRISRNSSTYSEFDYGADRERFKRVDRIGSQIRRTWYAGNAERIRLPSGSHQIKRRIAGRVVVTHTLDAQNKVTATNTNYLLKDHLGSVVAVLDGSGNNIQAMSYDVWGRRSNPNQWQQLLPLLQNDWSLTQYVTRGYTGHEPIDSMGLIHMNGRVYDPHLGRFTQADPFIQFPGSSQSYNRYSYVLNNPLAYTDPSGYSAWTKFRDKILKPVVAIVASYFTYNISSAWAVNAGLATEGGTMAGAIGGAAGGFVGGAINSGNLRGAASGAFGGMLFGAIGGHYGSLKGRDFWGWDGIASQGVAHGLAGGVMAELGGGKFGHGFAAAGVGFAGGAAGELGGLALEEQFVVATVAGGTASSLTGGKFANGALTSAFGFVFNQVQHRAAQKSALQKAKQLAVWFWDDLKSGVVRDRIMLTVNAELSIAAGLAEGALAYATGGAAGAFIGMHGAGNLAGGVGDYLDIFDGGSRDWNFTRQGYENIFIFSGQDASVGARAFYFTDAAIGVGALLSPVSVNYVGPLTITGQTTVPAFIRTNPVLLTHDAVQIGSSISSGASN